MQTDSTPHSHYGLENHGIKNVADVYWNSSTPTLYEEAIRRREGRLAHLGPLVVRTGQRYFDGGRALRRRSQPFYRAQRDDAPFVEDGDSVTQPLRFFQIVGRQEDRNAFGAQPGVHHGK